MEQKHIKLLIILVAVLLVGVVGVTFSFFNYTRTGALNNLGTGRIYFNSNQGDSLTLTNLFPMTSEEAEEANLDTITISITGDTTYVDGEEFVVSISDIENKVGTKRVPINYTATYTSTAGNSIGTSSNDYWDDRNDKDTNIYRLYNEGVLRNDKKILVGYIKSGETGISGTLSIKTFIDKDKIAISDTYSKYPYKINPNMTESELNACIDFIVDNYYVGSATEEEAEAYCLGTGELLGWTFEDDLNYIIEYPDDLNVLLSANVIIDATGDGTTEEWIDGRILLRTEEWNSFATTPLSFKVKVESNEGIWVNGNGTIDTCPGCKYLYTTNTIYPTWNKRNQTPTVITNGLYDNYLDLIETTGKDLFYGVILNNQNQITNIYACAIIDNYPYCMEGIYGGSTYDANREIIQGIWGNSCKTRTIANNRIGIECGPWDESGTMGAYITSDGVATFATGYYDECGIPTVGVVGCTEKTPY